MMEEHREGYKRVHFFKYFLNEEDWNSRHRYHQEKHELHNLAFHGEGLHGDFSTFMVEQVQPVAYRVHIHPGVAIDHYGRMLILEKGKSLDIETKGLSFPCTVYIKLSYSEHVFERVYFKDGRVEVKRYVEGCAIEVSTEGVLRGELELARIRLTGDALGVSNAVDIKNPVDNEIDLNYRRLIYRQRLFGSEEKLRLCKILEQRGRSFDKLGGHSKMWSMVSLGHGFDMLDLFLDSDVLKEDSRDLLLLLLRMFDDQFLMLAKDKLEEHHFDRIEWKRHVNNCKSLQSLYEDGLRNGFMNIDIVLGQLEKLSYSYGHLERIFGNDRRVYLPGQVHFQPKSYVMSSNWDFVKVWSAEFPLVFDIDDMEWLKVGELNIADEASEKKHRFRLAECKDAWRNRQRLYFPDGSLIEEIGIAHEGGYSEFVISGVIPDIPLAIIRMMDYARADVALKINVNGVDVGVSECDGFDRQYRWRNWPYVIPARYVNDTELVIKQTPLVADRDVNMFYYWFYQPIDY